MPLSAIEVDERDIAPRGGPPGTQVRVPGSGFGSGVGFPAAQIRVDPLGEDILATIVSWAPNLVVFSVPTLSSLNRIVKVTIEVAGGADSYTFPLWLPNATEPDIDYQWPDAEADGPDESVDDPRKATAADFNRMLDRLKIDDSRLDALEAETHAEVVDRFTPALIDGQTVFTLSETPPDLYSVKFIVNGVTYDLDSGRFGVGGAGGRTLTWAGFPLIAGRDTVTARYFS